MEIQRSEGTYKEDFELDASQITKLAHVATDDFQPSQADQPLRKKPSWMSRTTHTPETASQPRRDSSNFASYKFDPAEKGAEGDGGGGGGTPQLQTRMSGGAASQSVRMGGQQPQQAGPPHGVGLQQHAGGPLRNSNGQHSSNQHKPDWPTVHKHDHRYAEIASCTD